MIIRYCFLQVEGGSVPPIHKMAHLTEVVGIKLNLSSTIGITRIINPSLFLNLLSIRVSPMWNQGVFMVIMNIHYNSFNKGSLFIVASKFFKELFSLHILMR